MNQRALVLSLLLVLVIADHCVAYKDTKECLKVFRNLVKPYYNSNDLKNLKTASKIALELSKGYKKLIIGDRNILKNEC